MLNTDYKILTKCLALRLKAVLGNVINFDQTGYIQNRNIIDNVRLLIDIPEYCIRNNIKGIIFSIDFEKAFDSLSFTFLLKVLENVNFGKDFIGWIKILYTNINSCVLNNGYFTELFKLERGVRQGCPLSAYLFLLAVEVLGSKIRNTKQVKGIKIGNHVCKILQFADDTNCILADLDSLEKVINILEQFYHVSGLKINKNKSVLKYIVPVTGEIDTHLDFKWKHDSFHVLGVELCSNDKEMIDKNVLPKISSMKSLLNIWGQRNLSIKGKITVINSLVISKILYVASVIPLPAQVIYDI